MTYKVVIPSAGLGTRVGIHSKHINKALLTIGTKPAIAHIIDRFDPSIEIVIPIGYKGDYIRQVLTAIYPTRTITFVDVDPFEGEGSGLGFSLLCAKDHLQCPFIFVSNDTIVPDQEIDLDPNRYGNWMGYYDHGKGNTYSVSEYRTLEINHKDETVSSINPKGVLNQNIYIGLCGIKEYKAFWASMESDPKAITTGEAFGLKSLPSEIHAYEMQSWRDTGNLEALQKTKDHFKSDEYNILEKQDEAIWFIDDRVIKFSIDTKFIQNRIERLKNLDPVLFPSVIMSSQNVYVYSKVEGAVYSNSILASNVKPFLSFVKDCLWDRESHSDLSVSEEYLACNEFYRTKTIARVQDYLRMYEVIDQPMTINGLNVNSVMDALNNVPWADLDSHPLSSYHGDFHNENILIRENGSPVLIDWRQNFGPMTIHTGDIYYDFAKFHHGLLVSHSMVNQQNFSTRVISSTNVIIDILRPQRLVEAEIAFFEWLNEHCYNTTHVRLLTALIFLNIAVLHEHPYSLFLFYLGRYELHKIQIELENS